MTGGGSSRDLFAAEEIQTGLFYFCEEFVPTCIAKYYYYHDDIVKLRLEGKLSDLVEKKGVELWKSLPTVLGTAAAKAWYKLSKDEKVSFIKKGTKVFKARAYEKEKALSRVHRSPAARDEALKQSYKRKLEEAAEAELELEQAASDLQTACSEFCKEHSVGSTQEAQDSVHQYWRISLSERERSRHVYEVKKRRVEYHEKAMMKSKLAGASGPSKSKEDLEMEAYIVNWEKAAKDRERKIEKQMEDYKKDNSEKTMLFVKSGVIHLPNQTIVGPNQVYYLPATGYPVFMEEYNAKFPLTPVEEVDAKWDALSPVEKARYIKKDQKKLDANLKEACRCAKYSII